MENKGSRNLSFFILVFCLLKLKQLSNSTNNIAKWTVI